MGEQFSRGECRNFMRACQEIQYDQQVKVYHHIGRPHSSSLAQVTLMEGLEGFKDAGKEGFLFFYQ